mmetsp:Transcript_1786/g.2373  ORF Transcript_1786/g.2373 Transcript_1786/m.2373 type:complete len:80 (+) Transcript_1786:917-1156(+)
MTLVNQKGGFLKGNSHRDKGLFHTERKRPSNHNYDVLCDCARFNKEGQIISHEENRRCIETGHGSFCTSRESHFRSHLK